SYRQVDAQLLESGHVRARAAAEQLASLLAQSTQQQLNELKKVAQDEAIRAYLAAPSAALAPAARARLGTLARPGQPPIELWSAAGVRLLDGAPAKSSVPMPVLREGHAPPNHEGIGPFEA